MSTTQSTRGVFDAVAAEADFPRLEAEILTFWDEHDTFRRSLDQRRDGPRFVFYDGPPFANGLPHYGHLLANTLKDIVPRFWTMRGYYIERRFGWDCHGLPVEIEMERELGISGKSQIEQYGVARFNEACRSIVLRFTAEWRKTVRRMGRWVDFDRDYKTMDPNYMESIWWVFSQLWERDLVYRGYTVQPYCPRCSTPLSNFEVNQGYRDVQDPSITVRFPAAGDGDARTYFLVWTTTPWTLPANLGLAVGSDIDYVLVADGQDRYWLARDRVAAIFRDERPEILATAKGSKLVGRRYTPPFDIYHRRYAASAFRVVPADFVSTEEGTGIVHMAPAFGEDDFAIGQAEGWPVAMPVDAEGRFTAELPEYQGKFVKEADPLIIRRLRDEGKLVHQTTLQHAYPFCYRCDSPLIYRAVDTWFCRIEPLKQAMLNSNQQINWVPEHLRDGRFGKWLEGARDWNLSRNRYWGTPIPVWMSADGEEMVCVGSRDELERRAGKRPPDLHRHFVDDITIPSSQGKGELRRVPQVLDVWFESGSMPYAQNHYPFENREVVEQNFPADFIAEGLDQTRGWFYTLIVLSSALFDKPAFKNVIVNGLILAEDGKKMSKRLKNYPEPEQIFDRYGADALRAYLIDSPVVRAEDLRFSEDGIREVLRQVILPLWNAYSFFVTYANLDGWAPNRPQVATPGRLDRWILSVLNGLIEEVNSQMDRYNLYRVIPALEAFIDDLTRWYIRLSRPRFWTSDDDPDREAAYQTLYTVLTTFARVLAPFLPFTCEAIYRNLVVKAGAPGPESVHLTDYPEPDSQRRDLVLEREMALARTIVGLGRALRERHKLKTRQPLREVTVVARSAEERALIRDLEDLILEALNVKELRFTEREEDLVQVTAKANYRVLGRRFGKEMSRAAQVIQGFDLATIRRLETGGQVEVCGEGVAIGDVVIERREKEGRVTETGGGVTVSLDVEVTPELKAEGNAREVKNRIQAMRKEAGFAVEDRIAVALGAPASLREDLAAHADYLKRETLAVRLDMTPSPEFTPEIERTWDIDGQAITIRIRRMAAP
jgi:isoleucyl-tRNA synthetase